MKSEFLKLIKSDYVHIGWEAFIGGVIGYVYPILQGEGTFTVQNAKIALIGAILLGLRKGLTLWLTNSEGKILKPE